MQKFLQRAAEKLIKQNEMELECFITEEEGMDILQYIFEKTGKIYKLCVNENEYSNKTEYDCYILEADTMSVDIEYWPCWTR